MKTRKVILLSSALFLSMGLQAKRESANYSIGPETFAPLAGDANSSNYAQFSAVEPLSGLSVKDLPDLRILRVLSDNFLHWIRMGMEFPMLMRLPWVRIRRIPIRMGMD